MASHEMNVEPGMRLTPGARNSYQGSVALQKTVSLLDHGAGNLRSVIRAFEHVGARVNLVSSASQVAQCDHLVVPGQGAFASCMEQLCTHGLDQAILTHIESGRPYLGICLGLQLLFETSHEHGTHTGLGVLAGEVVPINPLPGIKVPHMGWNEVTWTAEMGPLISPKKSSWFYFVHSFQVKPKDALNCAYTHHGEPMVAAVMHENIFACQFHPEKSHEAGLQLLEAFLL
jgi:glutamine amidotransferase